MQNLDTEEVPNNGESFWIATTTDARSNTPQDSTEDVQLVELVASEDISTSADGEKPQAVSTDSAPTRTPAKKPAQKPAQGKALAVRPKASGTKALAKTTAQRKRPATSGTKTGAPLRKKQVRPKRVGAPSANAQATRSQNQAVPQKRAIVVSSSAAVKPSAGTRAKHFANSPKALPPSAKAPKAAQHAQAGKAAPSLKRKAPATSAPSNKPLGTQKGSQQPEVKPSPVTALAKRFAALPMPSVVLRSNKVKIPGAYHETGSVDTRSKLTKAKQFVLDQLRTPKMAVVGILLIIYVLGAIFWSTRFLPGTKINGMDASWSTPNSLAARLETIAPDYAASVTGEGIDLTIKQADINLSFNKETWKKAVKGLLPSFAWPFKLLSSLNENVTDGITYNEQQLENLVNAAVKDVNKTAEESKNASIEYNESKDAFVAIEEVYGTSISPSRALKTIASGVSTMNESIELTVSDLQKPTLTLSSDDFATVLSQANRLAHLSFDLTVNGKRVDTVTEDMVRSWLTINKSHAVVADLDKVTEWTRGDFSAHTDTVSSLRTYTRTDDGKRIQVAGGTYGWSVDGKKLAGMIRKQIAANSSKSIEVPFLSKGAVFVHGAQDWGPRYIDVDLSEQYVRMFDEDSNIVMQSECVTGNMAENNDTVVGVFTIEYKQSPATLIGLDEDYDGEPDYENEVYFWMPFYGGFGLHDALWRDDFGSDLYQTDGSHGCVNLPYYAAEILYGQCEAGDVVVVHW